MAEPSSNKLTHHHAVQRVITLRGKRFLEPILRELGDKNITKEVVEAALFAVTTSTHELEALNANLHSLVASIQSIRNARCKLASHPQLDGTVVLTGHPSVIAGLMVKEPVVEVTGVDGIPPFLLSVKPEATDTPIKVVYNGGGNGVVVQIKDCRFVNPMGEELKLSKIIYDDPHSILIVTNLETPLFQAGDTITEFYMPNIDNAGPFQTGEYSVDTDGVARLELRFPTRWITQKEASQLAKARVAKMCRTVVSFTELHLKGQATVEQDIVTYQFTQGDFDRRCLQQCFAAMQAYGRDAFDVVTLDDDRFIEARLCCRGVKTPENLHFSAWVQEMFKTVKVK